MFSIRPAGEPRSGSTPPRPEVAPDGTGEGSREEGDLSSVLRAASGGDEGAWRVVVDRYARRVYAMARSRVRSAELAEEVTQSVFVTVAATLGKGAGADGDTRGGYQEQGKFESWLFRVVMNRVRDEARRSARQAVPTDPERLADATGASRNGSGPAGGLDGAMVGALRGAIDQLPDADREVIELRHHGQMSFKAMADLLNEPLGTLLARHHRALKKLHSVLTGDMRIEMGEWWAGERPNGKADGKGQGKADEQALGSKGGRRHEP